MDRFGVNYDVGTFYDRRYMPPPLSRQALDADMAAIRDRLHANAVKLNGSDPEALQAAGRAALDAGLHVWLNPRLIDGNREATLAFLARGSELAEALRRESTAPDVVLSIGTEFTLDTTLFVPGADIHERGRRHFSLPWLARKILHVRQPYQRALNAFIQEALALARSRFQGPITYAAGLWEELDWSRFDIVSVNLYRAAFNARRFPQEVQRLHRFGKPVANTEFGCCAHLGGDKEGPAGYQILDMGADPPCFRKQVQRSEEVQAKYLRSVLETLEQEKVQAAFVFEFISRNLPHSEPLDLDLASFAITKWIPEQPGTPAHWEEKEAFGAVAECFSRMA